MLAAYINNTRATSAEIVRSMVLLAQLVKIPDRDKLILDALHALITEVEIDKVRSYAQTMYTTFLSVHEQERETLLKVLNTMGTIDLSTINNLL